MNSKPITLVHIYSHDMNIYGDWGNVLTLKRRLQWHGYTPRVVSYNPGDILPKEADIIIGGGGQDKGQDIIQDDLHKIGPWLHGLTHEDTPMLVVCGLYQLFGHFFRTQDNHIIKGIGLLDIETHAGSERLVGNIITQSPEFGEVIGYENHSGQTFLGKNVAAFGRVIKGAGNNGQDFTEGARYKNIIGTYLHGSLLPKNPLIADYLIEKAVIKKYGEFKPNIIFEEFVEKARDIAVKRSR